MLFIVWREPKEKFQHHRCETVFIDAESAAAAKREAEKLDGLLWLDPNCREMKRTLNAKPVEVTKHTDEVLWI